MAIFNNLPYSNLHELNLDWILRRIQDLSKKMEELEKNIDENVTQEINEIKNEITELQAWVANFDTDIVKKYVDEYIQTGVFFGLTNSGYFYAYIPDAWAEIIFRTTGYDIQLADAPEYGHLVLMFPDGGSN